MERLISFSLLKLGKRWREPRLKLPFTFYCTPESRLWHLSVIKPVGAALALEGWCSHEELNLDQRFRKPLLYPFELWEQLVQRHETTTGGIPGQRGLPVWIGLRIWPPIGLAKTGRAGYRARVHDDDLSEEHIRILRAMTPEQKLVAANRLYWTAREFKAAGLRMQHPDWTEAQIQEEVRRIFMYARS